MMTRPSLRPALAPALALVGALAGACGGPPRLVVELGAPVELTVERSTGFDPELLEDNGTATFAGQRLGSPTVSASYEGIDVLVDGERIWSLDAKVRAYLVLVDETVVKVQIYGESYRDAAIIETVGRDVTARFDAWRDKDPAYWPYIVRDLRVIATTTELGTVKPAGTFTHQSGVKATIHAGCNVNPDETTFRLQLEMNVPGRKY